MKRIAILLMISVTSSVFAAVYVNQNSNGSVEYTDTPSSNSSKVDVPPVNSVSSPAVKTAAPANQQSTTAPVGNEASSTADTYKIFEITSPANNATIQNQPVIGVEFKVEPNMLPGDKIQLLLDSKPVGTPTSTTYQELGVVERGTHTITAVIVNNKEQTIKQSASVIIYVHRNSTITSPQTSKSR